MARQRAKVRITTYLDVTYENEEELAEAVAELEVKVTPVIGDIKVLSGTIQSEAELA